VPTVRGMGLSINQNKHFTFKIKDKIMLQAGSYNFDVVKEYRSQLCEAKKWARFAIQNKKEGLSWHECAKISHEHLTFAIKIIR
jgi:hypothetical protein